MSEDLPVPQIGSRVKVPFGRSKAVGVCVATQVTSGHEKLKAIESILDVTPVVPGELMDLAHWMAGYYHYPLGEVLATILPAAARRGADCNIVPDDLWQPAVAELASKRAPAQQALFDYIGEHAPVAGEDLVAAGFRRDTLRTLVKNGAIEHAVAMPSLDPETPPTPTDAQAQAITNITGALDEFRVFLLEGVTGSGKTEVYLRSIAPVLERGKQVLVLVPEIALTPQTLARFQRRFVRVGMLHSNLTDHERLQTWLKCAAGQIDIVIGTRSAVFTPLPDPGLIIVDEEHDSSYKQQESLRYSARDLATKRALSHGIPIVMGTATPSLESIFNVQRNRYTRLELRHRAGGASMPAYHIIDMRGLRHTDGISLPLERVIRQHLEADGQVLVFLNRRGYSPSILCATCGWQAHCSDCDARLTLHRTPRQLVCHHCSLRFEVPDKCEGCGSSGLMPVGLGTQRTEQGLASLFPDVPIYRIDRDTTRSSRRLEEQFTLINNGASCIMVGTQMLAKGHHFPNVTLVAVINADAGFLSPDFRAPERTAQLIVQVAGRAGRAERPGEVWIQSFQPDNPTLLRLIEDGYPGFAQAELAERAKAGLPPTTPMAMLRAESTDATEAMQLLNLFKSQMHGVMLLGPVPAPMGRIANRSRFQLMVLGKNRAELHAALDQLAAPRVPRTLRWSIDVDPYDSL